MRSGYLFAVVFLAVAAVSAQTVTKNDTVTTADGLKYIVLKKGNGIKAENGKEVSVNYAGYLTDGKEFDSSYKRGRPIKFVLGQGQVIKGWDEAVALMHVGDKFRLIIPPDLAYGSRKAGLIPPNSTLIFDTELMGVSVPKLSLADTLLMAMFSKGIDSAVSRFRKIMRTDKDKYDLDEDGLNNLGYRLLSSHYSEQAIKLLNLNLELHPDSYNIRDLLAEAYMMEGKKDQAVKNLQEALKLNPKDQRAAEIMNRINGQK